MKKLMATAAIVFAASGASAQEQPTVAELTAQGKVLLASHFTEVNELLTLVLGTVEGAPEYICRTRYRGGSGYDVCRKLQ